MCQTVKYCKPWDEVSRWCWGFVRTILDLHLRVRALNTFRNISIWRVRRRGRQFGTTKGLPHIQQHPCSSTAYHLWPMKHSTPCPCDLSGLAPVCHHLLNKSVRSKHDSIKFGKKSMGNKIQTIFMAIFGLHYSIV